MNEAKHHYKIHKPEAIDLILKYNLSFVAGNIVKYILRSPFKGDRTGDLEKAMTYCNLLEPNINSRDFDSKDLQEYTELLPIEIRAITEIIRGKYQNYVIMEYILVAIESIQEKLEINPITYTLQTILCCPHCQQKMTEIQPSKLICNGCNSKDQSITK